MKKNTQRTKHFLLMMLLTLTILLPTLTQAQVATNYNFASSAGTYTPITGGTVLGTITQDDDSFDGIALPFPFSFSGTTMSHFGVNSNGYMALATSPATALQTNAYNTISFGATDNVIAAFNRDLQGGVSTGELSYTTLGTTPNRTLVVQWKDYRLFFGSGTPYNFQVRLSETTNVIRVIYGTFIGTATTVQVGLRGAGNADYNNRATTTDWSATTAGTTNAATCSITASVLPATGQTFTWTLASCIGVGGLTATPIATTTATLNWSSNVSAVGGYNVRYRAVGATTFITVPTTSALTTNITGLVPATDYEFQVQSVCAGVGNTSSFSPSRLFTTACLAFPIPYDEGFEGITANGNLPVCMARNDVNSCVTYTAPPAFSSRAARTGTKFASYETGFASFPAAGGYFYSAPLQLTAGQSYKFSVWYVNSNNDTWDVLEALVGTNQSPTGLVAIPGASVTLPTNITYQELTGIFTAPTTDVYYVALRAASTALFSELDFDDFSVTPPPACIAPIGVTTSALTTTTATVSWGAVTGSTGYNVQYRLVGAAGFTSFAGNPVTGTTANLTGLSPSSTYEIQVQNRCSAVLTSAFSAIVNFNTSCGPITALPYFEGFEGITTNGQLPNCMARTDPTLCLTYTSPQGFNNQIPRTGNKFGSFRWNTVAGGNYFYSAPLALIAGKTYDFSAWYITDGNPGWITLDAYVGPNQNPTGLVAIAGAIVSAPINTTHEQLAGSFVPATTGTYYVALRCVASFPPNFLSFDDLSVIAPCTAPTFTTLTLPTGSLATAYSQTIAATGGVPPYTFSVTNGNLPAGLTLNATTGAISGTPTVVNTTPPTFTVTVSDATSCINNKAYSIVVTGVPCVAINIAPTTIPAATLGVLYTTNAVQFVASGVAGATYNYSIVAGVLPSGMSLSSTTGNLTGTPTNRPASSSITVRARITTGTSAGCFGVITLDLTVNCPAMTFSLATIPDAVVNVPYSQQLSATYTSSVGPPPVIVTTGFTFTYSALPSGFTLSSSGLLSGISRDLVTPASVVITATRSNGCNISQTYTFGVVPTIAAPKVLKPIQISSNSFRARWEPVDRAVKYRLYIATSPDFDGGSFAIGYVGLTVVGDTSILVQGLKAQTKYYIQVTAISSADEVSPYSNTENCTTLSAITGIDNSLSSQVKVAPNPSKDKFLVDFGVLNLGKTTARVYDAQGRQVLSSEIGANVNQTTISLGNMANGIYLLEIISNKGRILKRLVKE